MDQILKTGRKGYLTVQVLIVSLMIMGVIYAIVSSVNNEYELVSKMEDVYKHDYESMYGAELYRINMYYGMKDAINGGIDNFMKNYNDTYSEGVYKMKNMKYYKNKKDTLLKNTRVSAELISKTPMYEKINKDEKNEINSRFIVTDKGEEKVLTGWYLLMRITEYKTEADTSKSWRRIYHKRYVFKNPFIDNTIDLENKEKISSIEIKRLVTPAYPELFESRKYKYIDIPSLNTEIVDPEYKKYND